jgi:uncharacterized membrane protein
LALTALFDAEGTHETYLNITHVETDYCGGQGGFFGWLFGTIFGLIVLVIVVLVVLILIASCYYKMKVIPSWLII